MARRASRHRSTQELKQKEGLATPALELLSIAAVLPVAGGDPELACALAGVAVSGDRARELADRARALHAELCAGEPAALDQLVRAGIARLAITAAVQPEQIAPGQRPHAAYALARLRESMGLTQAPRFTSIRLEVVGPDGDTLSIGPTNGARQADARPSEPEASGA